MIGKFIYIKFLVLIIIFLYDFKIISNIYPFFTYLENQIKFKHIEFYSKQCSDQKALKEFKTIDDPKISIISPIYNREK
jgi:hypothetical protein